MNTRHHMAPPARADKPGPAAQAGAPPAATTRTDVRLLLWLNPPSRAAAPAAHGWRRAGSVAAAQAASGKTLFLRGGATPCRRHPAAAMPPQDTLTLVVLPPSPPATARPRWRWLALIHRVHVLSGLLGSGKCRLLHALGAGWTPRHARWPWRHPRWRRMQADEVGRNDAQGRAPKQPRDFPPAS